MLVVLFLRGSNRLVTKPHLEIWTLTLVPSSQIQYQYRSIRAKAYSTSTLRHFIHNQPLSPRTPSIPGIFTNHTHSSIHQPPLRPRPTIHCFFFSSAVLLYSLPKPNPTRNLCIQVVMANVELAQNTVQGSNPGVGQW